MRFFTLAIAALIGASSTQAFNIVDYLPKNVEMPKPRPGALSASISATSINQIFQRLPVVVFTSLLNTPFEINYTMSSWLYKFEIKDFIFNTLDGFYQDIVFEEIPGTSKIHVSFKHINAQMKIDAELDALYFIPFKSSAVNITDASIDFVIEPTSAD
jgi:hypothetical protein